jgi:hypothetical protein
MRYFLACRTNVMSTLTWRNRRLPSPPQINLSVSLSERYDLIILRKIYLFPRSKLQSRPLGIDTVGYPALPRLTLAGKFKGPTNLVLIFRNKHDKSGKMHTTNRFGQ